MEELTDYYPLGKSSFLDTQEKLTDFTVYDEDKKILRELAKEKAQIAEDRVHKEKISLWKDLNSLKDTRPLVWINEIPWHEMNVNNQLKLVTKTRFSQFLETRLRRTIYLWRLMPADSIVEPTLPCYRVINNSGFGISEEIDVALTDNDSDIVSREFTPQIKNEDDVEKIEFPEISFDKNATEEKYQIMSDIFDGILEVEKRGMPGFWFAPWDELIRWWGVQEALTDLSLRPGLVHKVME